MLLGEAAGAEMTAPPWLGNIVSWEVLRDWMGSWGVKEELPQHLSVSSQPSPLLPNWLASPPAPVNTLNI